MESRFRHNAAATLDDYIDVIDRKTASLFHAGGKVAADLAGASTRTIDAMAKLGTAMGLAFQMVDDLLDILGPEEKIGKPVGSDLRAGIPSLPVVLGVERSPELRALFQNGTQMEGAAFERALDLLRDPEIIADARRLAAEQVAIARAIVGELEPSPYRDGLATLIDDQISREVLDNAERNRRRRRARGRPARLPARAPRRHGDAARTTDRFLARVSRRSPDAVGNRCAPRGRPSSTARRLAESPDRNCRDFPRRTARGHHSARRPRPASARRAAARDARDDCRRGREISRLQARARRNCARSDLRKRSRRSAFMPTR